MGMIDARLKLEFKQAPSVEVPRAEWERAGEPFSRRYGDVGDEAMALLRRVEEGDAAVWTDAGQESNIRLKRAFHDALGVAQIVFCFCDDLLTRVFELPWWREWEPQLGPILDKLGIGRGQVIRCLLARLPHNTTIPVHHDTGLWVLKSHRVHVPLVTSGQRGDPQREVVFKVGHSEGTLERVVMEHGVAVELNNRAKHFVQNNWDRPRVHLILDYVEPELARALPRSVLSPGQSVFQTRRSIFLEEPPSFRLPDTKLGEEALKERTLAILQLVQRCGAARGQSAAAAAELVDEFKRKVRRYSDGELYADDLVAFCADMCGGDRAAIIELFELKDLALFIQDAERQAALRAAYRRSMDGPRLFLVIGAMKCGTTSLYDYTVQHPNVAAARQKEPHFFDWKWAEVSRWTLSPQQRADAERLVRPPTACPAVAPLAPLVPPAPRALEGQPPQQLQLQLPEHEAHELRLKFMHVFEADKLAARLDRLVAGEATPSYLLGGATAAARVAQVLGCDLRLVVTLREPVARLYSHYQMTADLACSAGQRERRGTVAGKACAQLVEEDLQALAKVGIAHGRDPRTLSDAELARFDADYLAPTMTAGHGSHSYVGRGLYYLQLKLWLRTFSRGNLLVLRLDEIAKNPQAAMDKVFKHLGLAPHKLLDVAPRNTRDYAPMPEQLRKQVADFYAPHNEALQELLGAEFAFVSSAALPKEQ